MLLTFSSNSSGDVLMLEQHALLVLRALGRDYEVVPSEGVITHAQLGESIVMLEKAIVDEKNTQTANQESENSDEYDEDKRHPIQAPVSLAQRAFPLLAMMKKAQKNGKDQIVWRIASAW